MLDDAYTLLSRMYEPVPADHFYELRTFNGRAKPRWFGALPLQRAEFEYLSSFVDMQIPYCAAYHAVHPRVRRGGKEPDIAGYACLVLDIDTKDEANAAIRRLADAGITPSAVVASGRGGGHLYAFLDRFEPVEVAKPVARRLFKWIGGDPVWDAVRILRTPGTMNNKPGVNAPCKLIHFDPSTRYSLATIVAAMDAAGVEQVLVEPRIATAARRARPSPTSQLAPIMDLELVPAEQRARLDAIIGRLSARSRGLMERGKYPGTTYPSRSEAEMAVVRALVEAGANDDDIVTLGLMHPHGLGERSLDRGSTVSLELTIDKARSTPRPVAHHADRPRSRVRLLDFNLAGSRLVLDLVNVDSGHRFTTGISTHRGDVLAYARAAFGLADGQAWIGAAGRVAEVELREGPKGTDVAFWVSPHAGAA